ncbi:hypothetical protein F5Y04DRAFT_33579 [Hypomontagnella monticulosa]|nr:hypothetical protein F5Y04DRAFT_33579 [Hypomontagnella monticulosa]
MSASENTHSSDITEVGKRPYIVPYVKKPDLNVGDKVYLLDTNGSRKGPYIIASIPSIGKCTLSLEDGSAVNNEEEIDVNDVEAA